jgi:molecular chaperone DnaJ
MAKNFYDTLGVSKSASTDEIKRAYRKLAHQYHPDKGKGNEDKFKEVNEAYQVLSNAEKRGQYDQYGQTFEQAQRNGGAGGYGGFGGQGNPFGAGFDFSGFGQGGGVEWDLGDIFGDIFGARDQRAQRRTRGIDLEMELTLKFEEAVFGVEKTLELEKKDKCPTCRGDGAEPGTKVITCPKCHGQGQIRTQRRTIFGNIQSSVSCDRCDGMGKVPETPCHTCKGSGVLRQKKTIQVKIPAGIDNGQRIRVSGEGEVGYRDTNPGDLYLVVRVQPHPDFKRDGYSLYRDVPISFAQAALGAKANVQTLDGEIELKIPAGTQSGKVFRVGGKGVPHINSSRRGDLFVTARVIVPNKLTKKESELLQKLAGLEGETVEVNKGFWESIKGSF